MKLMRKNTILVIGAMVLPIFLIIPSAIADEGTIVRGGKLYDKWFKVIDAPKPADTHMSWPASNTKKKGGVTHRCKSCHGWDYMGKDGAYASGSYKTGIPGLRQFSGGNVADVIAILKDKIHGYRGKMSDADMGALAMFVTLGQVDMDTYIDRKTGKAKGNALQGKKYFATICVNCHGVDGRMQEAVPPLGEVSSTNPWETMHKILNGQPGEAMPGLRAFPFAVAADITAYLQTLPGK